MAKMDRLEEIKNIYTVDSTMYAEAFKRSHIGWLIGEVERLRETVTALSDSERVRDDV